MDMLMDIVDDGIGLPDSHCDWTSPCVANVLHCVLRLHCVLQRRLKRPRSSLLAAHLLKLTQAQIGCACGGSKLPSANRNGASAIQCNWSFLANDEL